MKKFVCLLLAVCRVFSFAACTASDQPQDPDTDNPAAGDNAAGSENAGDTAGADTGKEDQDADPSGEDSVQKPDDHQKDDTSKEDEASKPEQKPSASTDKPAASKPSASKPSTSKPSADKHDTDKANKPSSPLNLLNTVWKSYSEDDKFLLPAVTIPRKTRKMTRRASLTSVTAPYWNRHLQCRRIPRICSKRRHR